MPNFLLVVLHNYVRQNKLQVFMQLFDLLSIMFYTVVVLVNLITRQFHNTVDQDVTSCHNAIKDKKIYSLMAIIEAVSKIKDANSSFIDYCDARCSCYISWSSILKKHFKLLPAQYAFNYFFEFDKNYVNM